MRGQFGTAHRRMTRDRLPPGQAADWRQDRVEALAEQRRALDRAKACEDDGLHSMAELYREQAKRRADRAANILGALQKFAG